MTKILIISLFAFGFLNAFLIDKKVSKDESAFWSSHYNIPKYSYIAVIAMSAYEGTESRIGKTSWKALEAGIISQVITEGMKKATGRLRPRHTNSSSDWNEGGESFPSGHVSGMTAIVTPYILEYKDDKPLIQLLWALPLHQMGGRLKAQAHWQSDVIVGAIVGFVSGYMTYNMDNPFLLSYTKNKTFIGYKYKF